MADDIFEDENFSISRLYSGKLQSKAYQFSFETCYKVMRKEELIKSLTDALKVLRKE